MVEVTIELPKDMNKLCRTCMSLLDEDLGPKNYLIFEDKPTEYCEMLANIMNTQIYPTAELPESICSQCLNQLHISYVFKEQCLKVEKHLKSLLDNSTFEEEIKLAEAENEEYKYFCFICNETYDTYYLLCKHSIIHECEKSVTDRFLLAQTEEHKHVAVEISEKNISLIQKRKEAISENELNEEDEIETVDQTIVKIGNKIQEDELKTVGKMKIEDIMKKDDKLKIVNKLEVVDKTGIVDKMQIEGKVLIENKIGIEDIMEIDDTKKIVYKQESTRFSNSKNNSAIYLFTNSKNSNQVNTEICPICNFKFDLNSSNLDSHICADVIQSENVSKTTENDGNICNICDRVFKTTLSLSLHFLKHALLVESEMDTKIFTQYIFCDICGMMFDENEQLDEHLRKTHIKQEVEIWECKKCALAFESDLDLLLHDRDVGHSKEFFWDEFLNKEVTKDTFSCPLCNETFKSRELLNKHSVQHAIKRTRCRTCKAYFTTEAAYNAHLPAHPNYVHNCDLCGKNLSSKSALKSHMMGVHSIQRPFICPVCGKSFKTPNRLHLHKLIHSKEKKFVCSYCGYSTNKGGDLTVHIRTHTEERPYKCKYVNCGRGFKTASHLSEHIRRHLQIKNFRCNICAMTFGHHSTLKIHLMQHTGEKPFKCMLCNVNFRRKHHLKNHLRQHEAK